MKIAFFGYAWNPTFQVDAYMSATIDSLTQAGADVDVYLGSQLTAEYGIYGLKPEISVPQIAAFMEGEGYDGAIAFNNAMLLPEVLAAIAGRTATVIVDEPEHLFDHGGSGPLAAFQQGVEIVVMSTAIEQRLLREVESCAPRLQFMLPATTVEARSGPAVVQHPISWVASYVGDANLDQFIALAMEKPEYHRLMRRCLEALESDGDLEAFRRGGGPDRDLIAALPWRFDYFTAQMHNVLTNRDRVEVVERLAPLGLALFGNAGWRKLLTHNTAVLTALQPGPAPSSHEALRRIYDASKISINVPQSHIVGGAVQYRVLDVMASDALMITRRDTPSDLDRVFGPDCPTPTYADFDELEQLCARYLHDEPERRRLVAECNGLVAEGFSFDDRARTLLNLIGLEPRTGAVAGHRRWIDLRLFAES